MENKEVFIKKVFNSIADDYDVMNLVLTGGFFSLWQNRLLKIMNIKQDNNVLDVCCGSGTLTLKIAEKLDKNKGGRVIGIDFSEKMLEKARGKIVNKNLPVSFLCQDALRLEFPDSSFDKALNSFALRNLSDLECALKEMNRVLRNDGILYVLEVSKPDNHIIRFFFNIYYYKLVPLIGRISDRGKKLDGKYSAYEWLSESLKLFPEKKELLTIFKKAGFTDISRKSYGFGGISLYIAKK